MKTVETVLGDLAGLLWGNWMLFMLLGLGVFYTIVTGGIQFRSIPWIIEKLRPKKEKTEDTRDHKGTVSSIQALYMTVASCMGSESIVDVATALIGGGPDALFQMWAAAFLSMATEYAKIVLGLVFRQKGADGSYHGGPMYYIGKGLHARLLGVAAAVLLFFQSAEGTLIQSNTISDVAFQVSRVPKTVTGILMATAVIFIIGGGLRHLADVTQKIVPVMASLYIVGGIMVVFINLDSILSMFRSILQGICSTKAGMGAVAGLTMRGATRFDMARGLYSNEADGGSAAAIHSVVQMDHPARQGFCDVVEVFVDTTVICSTTGLSILASGMPLGGVSAALLAAETFGVVAPLFKYVVSASLISLASASIMSQWYFGHVSLMYIRSLKGDHFYHILFPILVLLGSLNTAGIVWSIQDCMLGPLVISNVPALLKLSPVVVKMTREFSRESQ